VKWRRGGGGAVGVDGTGGSGAGSMAAAVTLPVAPAHPQISLSVGCLSAR